MIPWTELPGNDTTGILLIADHASAIVPEGVDLGVPPELMHEHVAIDIGVADVARALGYPAILGGVSRLVIDLNREADSPGLVPTESDGHTIPGNIDADVADRITRWWRPYHDHLAARIAAMRPALIVSLHSFTPGLRSRPGEKRPWQVGVLYNQDERAPRIAIPLLRAAGIVTGDNEPYSGKILNATMNRHAEGNGIPYLGFEVRQDLIGESEGVAQWAARLRPVIEATRVGLSG
ncbi:N-formylglutamate amidohydrolase [Sphingomonas naphthae]|uniref:N-formylglutamate amidohydrolase n=1 Tax=Sphingomonas naphthae TaxID=1813468 RepID=A0ABY7TNK3_9SPHN|nr:N-formylglutamate amidohydrolase [Sphingomonas naphthae]WCT74812.1 N-formylglutamate amidohydrolase [Sphingomonas naphthae]